MHYNFQLAQSKTILAYNTSGDIRSNHCWYPYHRHHLALRRYSIVVNAKKVRFSHLHVLMHPTGVAERFSKSIMQAIGKVEADKLQERLFSSVSLVNDRLERTPGSLFGATALIAGTTIGAGLPSDSYTDDVFVRRSARPRLDDGPCLLKCAAGYIKLGKWGSSSWAVYQLCNFN